MQYSYENDVLCIAFELLINKCSLLLKLLSMHKKRVREYQKHQEVKHSLLVREVWGSNPKTIKSLTRC